MFFVRIYSVKVAHNWKSSLRKMLFQSMCSHNFSFQFLILARTSVFYVLISVNYGKVISAHPKKILPKLPIPHFQGSNLHGILRIDKTGF